LDGFDRERRLARTVGSSEPVPIRMGRACRLRDVRVALRGISRDCRSGASCPEAGSGDRCGRRHRHRHGARRHGDRVMRGRDLFGIVAARNGLGPIVPEEFFNRVPECHRRDRGRMSAFGSGQCVMCASSRLTV